MAKNKNKKNVTANSTEKKVEEVKVEGYAFASQFNFACVKGPSAPFAPYT